jgi:hypothetical protein
MKSFCLLACLLFAFSSNAFTQRGGYSLKDYVPSNVGDEWCYKNLVQDGMSPIVIKVSSKQTWRGREVFQRDENNGDYRLQFIDAKGLSVGQLFFVGDRVIEYEKAARLMPLILQVGQTYRSEVFYSYKEKGVMKDTGVQSYAVTVESVADVQTPLKLFTGCLVIRTRALRVDRSSGQQKGYDLKEWYAPNVGAVKVVGELFWKNPKGEVTRNFKINAELEAATINGQAIQRDEGFLRDEG